MFELELSLSSSELDDDDELELLEESDANPVLVLMLMVSACLASSGSTSFKTRNHFLDSLGRPRTVLWYTIGKFVLLQKFWVTATVSSKFKTTCQ